MDGFSDTLLLGLFVSAFISMRRVQAYVCIYANLMLPYYWPRTIIIAHISLHIVESPTLDQPPPPKIKIKTALEIRPLIGKPKHRNQCHFTS